MIYRELFRIEIDHQYFSANGGDDFVIVPDGPTQALLKGLHFILKSTGKGLQVLIPTDENGNPKRTLDSALKFAVFPGSTTFHAITDTSGLAADEIFHFSNAGLPATESRLNSSESTESGSLNGFKMIAEVEIQPTAALLSSSEPVLYQVVFEAKSAKWKYYFVSDHETTDLEIVDIDERLVFNEVNWDDDPTEKVGISLQSRFPEANLFLFESETPISESDQALKNLQLHRDGHVIVKHLPNPDIGDAAMKIVKIHKLISKQ